MEVYSALRTPQTKDLAPSPVSSNLEPAPKPESATINRDAQELLTIFRPLLLLLGLAAVAVVLISGQFPWFLLALGAILFFASCLPWRRFP